MISGSRCQAGDVVIALASSGPHSNGFSLIRKLLERAGVSLDDTPSELGGRSVADALLEPTRIYAEPVRMLAATLDVHAMAHITGGGLPGNAGRSLPTGVGMRIDLSSWERPAVFGWLASLGVEEDEMRRVFNLGVGYIAVVPAESAELAVRVLTDAGETAWVAGELVEGDGVVLH